MGSGTRRRGRRAVAGAVATTALALFCACSALIDHADSQCATNVDCLKFPGTQCVAGGCVAVADLEAGVGDLDALAAAPCTSTQDCVTIHGTNWMCRAADSTCVNLTSQDCASVAGHYTSDNLVLVGAILPLLGPHQSTGLALQDAIRLAVGDFLGGLPTPAGDLQRSVAVVICNESDNADRAATFLRDELRVPIIIGAGESATTKQVANDVTVPGGQLLVSPRATADLSAYSASGLVWRTCPSNQLEGDALVDLVSQIVVPSVEAQYSLAGVRVAIVHATDPDSTDLDAQLTAAFAPGGGGDGGASDAGDAGVGEAGAGGSITSLLDVSFGNPDDPTSTPAYSTAIGAVTQEVGAPDVIVLLGQTQAVSNVLGGIEANWPAGPHLPRYALSSGLQTAELLTLVGSNAGLRTRILGTAPGSNPATYPDLSAFLVRYRETFTDGTIPETFGVAQAYDALYTVAFAASITTQPQLVGTNVTDALHQMLTPVSGVPPMTYDVGPADIPTVLAALQTGAPIALNGASAPLAFDVHTGDLVSDVQVWCIAGGAGDAGVGFESSGAAYIASTGVLTGTVGTYCQQ
jgi:branched-chain amino acid transport system substrate-binding protein